MRKPQQRQAIKPMPYNKRPCFKESVVTGQCRGYGAMVARRKELPFSGRSLSQ